MNQEQLKRSMQSAGMETFVKYYEAFSDHTIEEGNLVDGLMKIEQYSESSARMKVTFSRRIFDNEREADALRMVVEASRVPSWVVEKAKYLLEKESE